MIREKILAEVIAIIVDLFEEEKNLKDSVELSTIKNFDSLGRLNLFMALEQCFVIRFTIDEILSAKSIEDLVDMIVLKEKSK